ncbi:unnamed protein product [Meganyctiphanes norvegica]|uniref:G-protein coupled receptors family 2 profile 2 domain-containing protein n=1 Tax=Meganyctiphanes norvegica TaxID=48144 RepID=A0AAV2Q6P3_MEGNR
MVLIPSFGSSVLINIMKTNNTSSIFLETENVTNIEQNITQIANNLSLESSDNSTWKYWLITTLAGLASLFLLIYLILFLIKPDSKKLSNKVLASFSLGLFAVNFLGLFLPYVDNISDTVCFVSGASMYYISLCRYCWMNLMAFDVWRAMRLSTSKLRRSTGSQRRRFYAYCACGWCLPLPAFIGMISLQFAHSETLPKDMIPFSWDPSEKQHCNLFNVKLLSIFYYGPIAVSFLLNIVFFSLTAQVMYNAKKGAINSTNSELTIQFKMYIRLAVLLGVVCICFLVMGKSHVYDEVHIVVAFLNFVQATAILICFGFRRPSTLDRSSTIKSSSIDARSFRRKLSSTSSKGTAELSLSSSSEGGRHQSFRNKKSSNISKHSLVKMGPLEQLESNKQQVITEELTNQITVLE